MLIQFSVKNYRSIKDEAELQLTTDAGKELIDSNTFQPDAKGANNLGLMKSAVIYGANAAGKSNIINALSMMQWMVQFSATKLQSREILNIEQFMFSNDSLQQPSEFNIDFICEGTRYQYGFSATNLMIREEWLFAYPNGRAQTWFVREYDDETRQHIWTKDSYLTGAKATWKEATRDNALFLSTAIQLNSKQLGPIYQWFTKTLRVISLRNLNHYPTAYQMMDEFDENRSHKDIIGFLKTADLAIESVYVEKEEVDISDQFFDPPYPQRITYDTPSTIKTGHRLDDGSLHYLNLSDESDGTRRMFSLAWPIVESLRDGAVVFIDELNNSLHPTMVKFLVSLFNSTEQNPNNAQLIFTTHETSILSQEVFRRDQIWFCEKDKSQSTTLYSLSDFKVRKGAENIERNYLSGKYGALPFIDKSNLGDLHE